MRVRLIDIAGTALNMEVLSYVLTRDFNEFAAVREDLAVAHHGCDGGFRAAALRFRHRPCI